MRTAPRLLAVAAALALLASGCGGDDDDSIDQATGGQERTTTSASEDADVAATDTDLGLILVDAEGNTLYMFDNDAGGRSTCEGGCAQQWPPLETGGDPTAGPGVEADLLGTTDRGDGTTQVTYDGQPLYTYAPDGRPGDTSGQGVGGVWWVVGADGEPVRDGAGGADATTTTAQDTGIPGY